MVERFFTPASSEATLCDGADRVLPAETAEETPLPGSLRQAPRPPLCAES